MVRRNTIQRELVLETVKRMQCHATADEVYQAIACEHANISKGTVYRNLNLLSESGEIRKVEVPGGAERFDHILTDHYHVKCQRCGRIFDVDMDYMQDLAQHIRDTRGFQLEGHSILFHGVCPDCQRKT